ncbi:putative nuclease HARBI1 [Hordeum vulgare]|nr:putative nuclease HARBI1 [Hordeum vulgare]
MAVCPSGGEAAGHSGCRRDGTVVGRGAAQWSSWLAALARPIYGPVWAPFGLGRAGSAHDANILSNNMSHHDGINIPDGKFYLGDAGYACWPGVLPPFRKTRYHLNEFAGINYPRTPRELFNLTHSSLRVTIERAFEALKNRFKIMDHKPFRPYPTQVKLVLACCIIHNWILRWGVDEFVREEEDVTPHEVISYGHGVEAFDNEAWKNKMLEWAQAMWDNIGQTRI